MKLTHLQCARDNIDHALRGINSCCFAYGQTGSGKTYSIFGEDGGKRGILPRAMEYLFQSIDSSAKTRKVGNGKSGQYISSLSL